MRHSIIHFLIAALSYAIAARFGLALAIPPGFASAVWPAAGIALAAVTALRLWPALLGIGCGSFLINLAIISGDYHNLTATALIAPLCIASGAMSQAAGGYLLQNRFIGKARLLESPRTILLFTLIIALGGCLIASTIGVTTLFFNGIITADQYFFTWLTWWIGDAIGVLLFTPLLLNIFYYRKQLTRSRLLQSTVPTTVIFLLVWGIFYISIGHRHYENQQVISGKSDNIARELDALLTTAEHKLVAYAALFNASEHVSFTEFNAFSKVILDDDPVFYGVGWTPVVAQTERQELVNDMRQQGYPDFELTEFKADGSLAKAADRDEYYPVYYLYPLEQNRRAFGLNLAANPERREALMNARKLRHPVATAPIVLAQESGEKKATIIYMPIFDTTAALRDSKKENYSEFIGFASGVLKIHGLLENIWQEALRLGLSIQITDVTDKERPQELFTANIEPLPGYQEKSYLNYFSGRTYHIQIYANKDYVIDDKDWASWVILTGGFLLAAIMQMFILVVTGSLEYIRDQVRIKTEDLTIAMQKANAANKAKSQFLANMSHEFRTPLNAIIGFTQLCLKTLLNDKQKDYLTKVQLSSQTLLALINQSLDYAKIESGRMELDNARFSLENILKKIGALFLLPTRDKNLEFSIILETDIPAFFMGDELRVEQILINLLSNAFKFTSAGNICLRLNYDDRKQYLHVRVSDTGIGISANQIKFLFEAFRQADASTSRRFGGTGLGLSISKELVVQMGGDITISSQEGIGSEFHLWLQLPPAQPEGALLSRGIFPCTESNNSEPAGPAEVPAEVPAESSRNLPLQGKHILLAEDALMNQLLAQELLESFGARVTIANHGQEALDLLQQELNPDLILMDIQMPVMDGLQTSRTIRQQPQYSHIPIIAMTANAMENDVTDCLDAGMQAHIAKPIDAEKLQALLLYHLHLH